MLRCEPPIYHSTLFTIVRFQDANSRHHLEIIFRLEFIPSLIKRAEDSTRNHALLRGCIRRNLWHEMLACFPRQRDKAQEHEEVISIPCQDAPLQCPSYKQP